jgi:hypothetical protein
MSEPKSTGNRFVEFAASAGKPSIINIGREIAASGGSQRINEAACDADNQ